jgi:alkylhydroperoxidase family enzyme
VGRALGITENQLRDLPAYRSSPAFSPLEKAVIEYAEGMTKTPVEVSDAVFAALRERLEAAQLVELTASIAWENYRARFDHALGIGAQGFSEGAFCALPEPPQPGADASKRAGA